MPLTHTNCHGANCQGTRKPRDDIAALEIDAIPPHAQKQAVLANVTPHEPQIAMAKGTRKPRDDITALVIDAIPPGAPDARLPPLLAAKTGSGRAGTTGEADAVDIAWPLTGEGSGHWRRDAWWVRRQMSIPSCFCGAACMHDLVVASGSSPEEIVAAGAVSLVCWK